MPEIKQYVSRWFAYEHNLNISSAYGPRRFYSRTLGGWTEDVHRGIDYSKRGCLGQPVKTPWHGIVTHSRYNAGGYGHYVAVQISSGHRMIFAHLNERLVKEGQQVFKGDVIGTLGSSGQSSGPHLHFQINKPSGGVASDGYWGNPDEFKFSQGRSGTFHQGDNITFIGTSYLRVREHPTIQAKVVDRWHSNTGGVVYNHIDNGIETDGYFWWFVGYGWVAEVSLELFVPEDPLYPEKQPPESEPPETKPEPCPDQCPETPEEQDPEPPPQEGDSDPFDPDPGSTMNFWQALNNWIDRLIEKLFRRKEQW